MLKLLKYIYIILSSLTFIGFCGIVLASLYSYSPLSEKTDKASKEDAVFVLNHGNIVTDQDYEVIYSYESSSHPLGDHTDYYCLEIEKFELNPKFDNDWVKGPEKNEVYINARDITSSIGDIGKCFKGEKDPNSENIFANIWSIKINRDYVIGGRVILYHEPTKRVLYVSFET